MRAGRGGLTCHGRRSRRLCGRKSFWGCLVRVLMQANRDEASVLVRSASQRGRAVKGRPWAACLPLTGVTLWRGATGQDQSLVGRVCGTLMLGHQTAPKSFVIL